MVTETDNSKPRKIRALDLFCKAGGASGGLVDAGFDVTGVDIEPQPNYPYRFMRADAVSLVPEFLRLFDFIWASPPCQRYSAMTKRWGHRNKKHPDLVGPVREMLKSSGVPYVIENVMGSPLENAVMLCGSMFGLQTKQGSQLRRHRLFEASFPIKQLKCQHNDGSAIGVYGGGQHPQRRIPATIGVYGHAGGSSKRDNLDMACFTTQARRDAMGIQWMSGKELSQAVPPAYAHYIATEFLRSIPSVQEEVHNGVA